MKLTDLELTVGVVVYKDDPLHLGRLKVESPGFFDTENNSDIDTKEAREKFLMWCNPLFPDYQHYSQLECGSKVWLIHNTKNYYGYYYYPYFELNDNTRNLIDNKALDILVSRAGDIGDSQLYYKHNEGFVEKTGDYHITLNANGNVDINCQKSIIETAPIVKIGKKDGEYENAVMGSRIQKLLSDLVEGIKNLSTEAMQDPYTTMLSKPLSDLYDKLAGQINDILSETVFISK